MRPVGGAWTEPVAAIGVISGYPQAVSPLSFRTSECIAKIKHVHGDATTEGGHNREESSSKHTTGR